MAESPVEWSSTAEQPDMSAGATLALVVGFLGLAAGIVRAWGDPATGYEASLYLATPITFWVGVGVAMLVAVVLLLTPPRGRSAPMAVLLAGTAVVAAVSLPLLRGYHFYGLADSLTHLGWARELLEASMGPMDLLYPSGHLFAGTLSKLTGMTLRRALLFTVPVFVTLYFTFVALTVRALVPRRNAAIVGVFVAFLLLPVFNVGTTLMFVPFMLGILLTPLVLFLLVVYLSRPWPRIVARLPVTTMDVGLFLVGLTLLTVHPQVFSNLLILLGSMTVVQFGYRLLAGSHPVAGHRRVVGLFAVFSVMFVLWNMTHSAAVVTIEQMITALTGGADAGAIVQQRGSSLSEIGAGLPELFAKLFLIKAVVLLFGAWVVLRSLRTESWADVDAWARYLLFAAVPMFVYDVLHFFGDLSSYFFRHLGFAMFLGSIAGAIGVYEFLRSVSFDSGLLETGVSALGVVVVLLALALSLAVVFPSPYIYMPSYQVTETEMTGYETAFDHRAEGVGFAGIRGGPERYSEAMPEVSDILGESIYGEAIRAGLPSQFDSDSYLVVTQTDRIREITAYRELRVRRSDFRRIGSTAGVSHVVAGGGFDMFYVNT